MGVYFLLANFDKKEFVRPHRLGSGAKLPEITGSDFTRILPFLLIKYEDEELDLEGHWHGDRIGFVSDSGDEESLYDEIHRTYHDISARLVIQFNKRYSRFQVGVPCASCKKFRDAEEVRGSGPDAQCAKCRGERPTVHPEDDYPEDDDE